MRIINDEESSSHTGSDEEDQGFKVKNDYTWKEEGGKLDDSDGGNGSQHEETSDQNGAGADRSKIRRGSK